MNMNTIKKISSILLIGIGAVLLVMELASSQKNYYFQSIGIVCLMLGLFTVNSKLESRSAKKDHESSENRDEE